MFPSHMIAAMATTTLFLSQMAKLEISISTHLRECHRIRHGSIETYMRRMINIEARP
jgi:hypothetical protein